MRKTKKFKEACKVEYNKRIDSTRTELSTLPDGGNSILEETRCAYNLMVKELGGPGSYDTASYTNAFKKIDYKISRFMPILWLDNPNLLTVTSDKTTCIYA